MYKKSICLIVLFFTISWSAIADDNHHQTVDNHYQIQLAAVEKLELNKYESAEQYGSITVSEAGNNMKRVRLGAFESNEDAKNILKKVKLMGFSDAFIVQGKDKPDAVEVVGNIDYSNPVKHPAWKNLTSEQQNNVVILDGKLHIKEAGNFVPLDTFR